MSNKVITDKQTYTHDREFKTNDITIVFDFLLVPDESKDCLCSTEIITWSVTSEGDMMRLYVMKHDDKVGFYWKLGPYYDGQLLNQLMADNSHIKKDHVDFSRVKCTWNQFQLRLNFQHVELSINGKKKRIIVNEQIPIPVLELIRKGSPHVFVVKGDKRIVINNLKVVVNPIDEVALASRKRFCQIKLSSDGGDGSEQSNKDEIGQIFLTPEISYMGSNGDNDKTDKTKKKYISIKYTNTMSQLCLANPFTSLRAFFVDILFKNLILFGLLFAFLTYFGDPALTDLNTKLIICAVVCILYNLLNFIFNTLQNIAVWACQYSNDIGGLVSNQP